MGFAHSILENSFFIYRKGDMAYLILYINDIILTNSSEKLRKTLMDSLSSEFFMKYLGSLKYFLGISITCTSFGIFLSQKKYAQ